MLRRAPHLFALALLAAAPVRADIVEVTPDGLNLHCEATLAGTRAEAWRKAIRIQDWWSDAHTYSGAASNLRLEPRIGGMWRETWREGEVQHGRVVMAIPGRMLRVDAALGPLQDMGVSGALTFTFTDGAPGFTSVGVDYRVGGGATAHLNGLAAIVNQVLCEQVKRLDDLG